MKQILIATTNPGKIMTFKKILKKLGYEGLSFSDLNLTLNEPDETELTAKAIAAEKALGYAKQYKDLPVLARDDTNTLIGVDEEDDLKNHNKEFIARRMGKYSDENGEKVLSESPDFFVINSYKVKIIFSSGLNLANLHIFKYDEDDLKGIDFDFFDFDFFSEGNLIYKLFSFNNNSFLIEIF